MNYLFKSFLSPGIQISKNVVLSQFYRSNPKIRRTESNKILCVREVEEHEPPKTRE